MSRPLDAATTPATRTLFDPAAEPSCMTWGDLFDAAADVDVTERDVREALREHREDDDA